MDLRRPERRTPRQILVQKTLYRCATGIFKQITCISSSRHAHMEPEEPEDDGNDDECLDDGDAIDTDEDMDDNICTYGSTQYVHTKHQALCM